MKRSKQKHSGWLLDQPRNLDMPDGWIRPGDVYNNPANRLYVGERGGRYYKRTRADGTTYRDYTW